MEPESVQPQPVQSPPPQPPPLVPPEQSVTKPTQRKAFYVTVIILALVIIGVSYAYIQKNTNEQSRQTQASPTPTPAPTIYKGDFNKIDTSNWKEVVINKTKFGGKLQFLIPSNVSVCDPSDTLNGPPIPCTFGSIHEYFVSSGDNSKCNIPTIFIRGDNFPYGLKIEWTYLKNDVSPLSEAGGGILRYDVNKARLTDFGFGDEETYLASGNTDIEYRVLPQINTPPNSADKMTKQIYYERVMFYRGDQIIVLTIQTDPDKTNLDIYRQILSTFKFINATDKNQQTTCNVSFQLPQGWQTTNSPYPFIFSAGGDTIGCFDINAPDYDEQNRQAGKDYGLQLRIDQIRIGATFQGVQISDLNSYLTAVTKISQNVSNNTTQTIGSYPGIYFELGAMELTSNFAFINDRYIYNINWPKNYSGQYKTSVNQIISSTKFTVQ